MLQVWAKKYLTPIQWNKVYVGDAAYGVTGKRLPDATFHSDQDKLDSRPSLHRRDALAKNKT